MKNLIIHPSDSSTDFLKPIYGKVNDNDKTVVAGKTNPLQVLDLIKRSDRILMMGHGCPAGLFSMRMFTFKPYVVGNNDSDILRDKDNIYIWCHANKFVEKNDLHGFYSGMFISEVREAQYCGLRGVTQAMVNESNDGFAEILGNAIDLPKEELYEKVVREYGVIAEHNPVAQYNLSRLAIR